MKPLRKIVSRKDYQTSSHPHGTRSVELELECGHKIHCKGSKEPKYKARCGWCKDK